MSRFSAVFAILICSFACKGKQDKPIVENPGMELDSTTQRKRLEYFNSTITVQVASIDSSFSADFSEFIWIAEQLNYAVSGKIDRRDSMDFHCWRPVSEGSMFERLVYHGLRTHSIYLKEVSKNRVKKGMFLEEALFPSLKEAKNAEKKIRDFIYQDSTTNAYDKRPTDIFRYQNRVYKLSVGSFSSIPDMKTACRRFRKKLGPSIGKIMLWDYYGYGE